MKTILLALDFEGQSTKILEEAKKYALAFNAHLHLVHVSTLLTKAVNYDPMAEEVNHEARPELNAERRLLKQLCLNLKEDGVNCDFSIVEGDVSVKLLEQANKLAAELIIVGHHQHGFLMRALLKSTSEEALQKTNIPLLVIPLDA
jgi:nucleotide-binding universal stress UspA family protein